MPQEHAMQLLVYGSKGRRAAALSGREGHLLACLARHAPRKRALKGGAVSSCAPEDSPLQGGAVSGRRGCSEPCACALCLYLPQMDLRPQGHMGPTAARRGSHHGGGGAAGSTHRRRHRSSRPEAPPHASVSGERGGQHSPTGGVATGAANKSMHALPMPQGGWPSLESRNTASEMDLKQVEKLGKPLLFRAHSGGRSASPGEGEAEEDVAVAIDSPSKLFGGAGHT